MYYIVADAVIVQRRGRPIATPGRNGKTKVNTLQGPLCFQRQQRSSIPEVLVWKPMDYNPVAQTILL
jgi:hypothetical protein